MYSDRANYIVAHLSVARKKNAETSSTDIWESVFSST